jgi:hypothetical protein
MLVGLFGALVKLGLLENKAVILLGFQVLLITTVGMLTISLVHMPMGMLMLLQQPLLMYRRLQRTAVQVAMGHPQQLRTRAHRLNTLRCRRLPSHQHLRI